MSQERLLEIVRELVALGPRMGGTPSGDAAARYHAQRFRAAGLEPVVTVDPGKHAFQPLSLSARVAAGGSELRLEDGCLALHTKGVEACELELRRHPPERGAGAPYALFVEESELRTALQLGKERAPRVLLVACERRVERSSAVLHQPPGYGGTLLTASAREAKWLRARLGAGAATLKIAAEVFEGTGRPLTVSADVAAGANRAAPAPGAPVLLFCAHGDSDSGGPGADDNASGNAVVIELATVFARLQRDGMRLPFSLRFVIWGSEIHSSEAWFAKIQADGSAARHLAVVNFDQAGTGAERDCVYFEPDDLPLCQPLVRLGLAMAGDYVGREGFWTEYVSNAALGGTDSYVFTPGWRRGGDPGALPAITIFSAAFGHAEEPAVTAGFRSRGWKGDPDKVRVDYSLVYHESGDRPEFTTELEPWNMVWITRASGLLALRLAASPETVKKLLDR